MLIFQIFVSFLSRFLLITSITRSKKLQFSRFLQSQLLTLTGNECHRWRLNPSRDSLFKRLDDFLRFGAFFVPAKGQDELLRFLLVDIIKIWKLEMLSRR